MEQDLINANAQIPATRTGTQRVINWGGVLQGAAIVTALVVVAAVALPAFGALGSTIATAIEASPTASGIATGIEAVIAKAGEFAAASVAEKGFIYEGLKYAGQFFGHLGNSALGALGAEGTVWGAKEATGNAIGTAFSAATVAVTAKAVLPSLQNIQLGADVPMSAGPSIDHGLLAAQGAHGANTAYAASHSILHDATHAAHHAAEETNERAEKRWSDKFANRSAHASHSDAVRSSSTASRAAAQPAASFSEQLNADRANLDVALAK